MEYIYPVVDERKESCSNGELAEEDLAADLVPMKVCYSRYDMLKLSSSPLSQITPDNWDTNSIDLPCCVSSCPTSARVVERKWRMAKQERDEVMGGAKRRPKRKRVSFSDDVKFNLCQVY